MDKVQDTSSLSPADRKQLAQEAMARRSKKVESKKETHYAVIGVFLAIILVAILFSIFSPKANYAKMQIIDDTQILVHNGQGHQFKHGKNEFFKDKTIADVKSLFTGALSDTNQISSCKTSVGTENPEAEEKIDLPESYDWRKAFPKCVQPVADIGADQNCSSSFVMATLSASQDRICMTNNQTVKLAAQELIDCDAGQYGCEGGYANKVLNWGRKKGFISEECMPYQGKQSECDVDHFETNECRVENQVYRVQDFCIAVQDENLKRELFKNGPIVSQMTPYTDFLAYKEGTYHRTQDSFKFSGYHIVKLVGWSKSMDGNTEWIVENSWGADWGENGYVRMQGGRGDTMIDQYALGMNILGYTEYDYSSNKDMYEASNDATGEASESSDDYSSYQSDDQDSNPQQMTLDQLTKTEEDEEEENSEL